MDLTNLFTETCHVLESQTIMTLQRENRQLRAQMQKDNALLTELLKNWYLRAVLSLIEDHKSQGYGCVDVIDDIFNNVHDYTGASLYCIEDYTVAPMNWDDPSEREDVIPFLRDLGYGVLCFNGHDAEMPFSVHWDDYEPSPEELLKFESNGWTWFPPTSE